MKIKLETFHFHIADVLDGILSSCFSMEPVKDIFKKLHCFGFNQWTPQIICIFCLLCSELTRHICWGKRQTKNNSIVYALTLSVAVFRISHTSSCRLELTILRLFLIQFCEERQSLVCACKLQIHIDKQRYDHLPD